MKVNIDQILHIASAAKLRAHKDGYLYKKSGKRNTSPNHSTVRWQKRWCIVYYNYFFYFENKDVIKPQGVIFLEGTLAAAVHTAARNIFCFGIGYPGEYQRQYLFACNSNEERENWLFSVLSTTGSNLETQVYLAKKRIDELEKFVESIELYSEKCDFVSPLSNSSTSINEILTGRQRVDDYAEELLAEANFNEAKEKLAEEFETSPVNNLTATALKIPINTQLSLKDDDRLREDADDIKYSDELAGPYHLPKIVYGSVDRLMERLCDPRLPGADFMETFLLTYRAFTTSKVVMENLIKAYWKVMDGKPSFKDEETIETDLVRRSSTSSQPFMFNDMSNISLSSVDGETTSTDSGMPEKKSGKARPESTRATTQWCQENVEQSCLPLQRSASACTMHRDKSEDHDLHLLVRSQSAGTCSTKPMPRHFTSHEEIRRSNTNLELENIDEHASDATSCGGKSLDEESLPRVGAGDGEDSETDLSIDNEQAGGVSLNTKCDVAEEAVQDNESVLSDATFRGPFEITLCDVSVLPSVVVAHRCNRTSSCTESDVYIAHDSCSVDDTSIQSIEATCMIDTTEHDRSSLLGSIRSETSSIASTPDMSLERRSMSSNDAHEADLTKGRTVSENALSLDNLSVPDTRFEKHYSHKRHFTSPIFHRKKKDENCKQKKDKEKFMKRRSSSDTKTLEPILLNVKESMAGVTYGRSESMYETLSSNTPLKDSYKTNTHSLDRKSSKTASVPVPIGGSLNERHSANSTPRRKRSVFNTPFSPFKKGLKRSSSEQVLPVNVLREEFVSNLSSSSLNLDERSERRMSDTSVDSGVRLSSSLNENEELKIHDTLTSKDDSSVRTKRKNFNFKPKTLRKDKSKNKLHGSFRNLMIFQTSKEEKVEKDKKQTNNKARRKTSVVVQGRPPVDRNTVSVNRGPLKIMSIFKHWLTKHPKDFIEDLDILKMLEDFFIDIKSDPRTFPVVKEIVGSLEKALHVQKKTLSAVHPFDELLHQRTLNETASESDGTCVDHEEKKLPQDFSYSIVATNMTLLEHYLYAKISFNEFISCQWTRKDKEEKAPGIMKFIKRFNQVTKIISYYVVHGPTPESRASLIEFWLRVAAHCRDLNNFNAIMEIISALNASSVRRLKKSWDLVAKPLRDVFTDLETLVSADRSFKTLRAAVHMCNPPCVPYLGSYLSDLLFVHDGGKTFDENGLVNFSKMCRISKLVREVKCYQQLPYSLEFDKEVACALVDFDKDVDEDSLYERSLLAEPRDS